MACSNSSVRSKGEDRGLSTKKYPPAPRKQLHILYLLHDTLHCAKHHTRDLQAYNSVSTTLKDCIQGLVKVTSAWDARLYPRNLHKLHDLFQLWEGGGYFDEDYIQELRDAGKDGCAAKKAPQKALQENGSLPEDKKSPPFIMPASHGDALTPFYDLPAGNMMPHIIPNSTNPINPQLIKPLQFAAGPAEHDLAATVKAFLNDIDSLDQLSFEESGHLVDIDELGQIIVRDRFTKEIILAEGYYGWSRSFCEKMKRREDVATFSMEIPDANCEGVVRSSRKRQRQNFSQSRLSRSRSASSSRSRRFSRERYRSLRSRSRSRSPSRSYSPPSPPPYVTGPSPSLQALPASVHRRSPPRDPRRPPSTSQQGPVPPFFQSSFNPGLAPSPVSVAIPPRPPNYDGPWPPPPPPPIGPRVPQASYPSTSPFHQHPSVMPMGHSGWSHQQQQQPNQGSSSAYGAAPLMQGLYNGTVQNNTGWGNGRGGFGR